MLEILILFLKKLDVHDFKRYENDALGRLEIRKKYRELINLGFKDVIVLKIKQNKNILFGTILLDHGKKIMV